MFKVIEFGDFNFEVPPPGYVPPEGDEKFTPPLDQLFRGPVRWQ